MKIMDRVLHHVSQKLTITSRSHQGFGLMMLAAAPIGLLYAPLDSFAQVAVFLYAAALMCVIDLAKMTKHTPMLIGFVLRAMSIASVVMIEGASLLIAALIFVEILQCQASDVSKKDRHLLNIALIGPFILAMMFHVPNTAGAFMSAILACVQMICLISAYTRTQKVAFNPEIVSMAANQNVKPVTRSKGENSLVYACTAQGDVVAVNGGMFLPMRMKSIRNIQELMTAFSSDCQSVMKLGMLSAVDNRVTTCALATKFVSSTMGMNSPIMVEIIPIEHVPVGEKLDERADVLLRLSPMGIADTAIATPMLPLHSQASSCVHQGARSILSHSTISGAEITRSNRRSSIAM